MWYDPRFESSAFRVYDFVLPPFLGVCVMVYMRMVMLMDSIECRVVIDDHIVVGG